MEATTTQFRKQSLLTSINLLFQAPFRKVSGFGNMKNDEDSVMDMEILRNQLAEREARLKVIMAELDRERTTNRENVQLAGRYKNELAGIAEKMLNELNHEESILHQYESLSKRHVSLEKKYVALTKSPLVKIIYLSWKIYNKIRYNRD